MRQKPNKYYASDDGKIYIVNDDGSFTNIGNVNDVYEVQQLKERLETLNSQKNRNKVQIPISYEQVEKKTISKNVVTYILIGLFLIACVMAIINS